MDGGKRSDDEIDDDAYRGNGSFNNLAIAPFSMIPPLSTTRSQQT